MRAVVTCALAWVLLALGAGASEAPRLWRWQFPQPGKRIALLYTGHEFAEGMALVLDALNARGARASFFFTGDFLRRAEFAPLVRRVVREGHYLGPHSDRHLLYCSWDSPPKTLVSRAEFRRDVVRNVDEVVRFGVRRSSITYWVPAYEWANPDITLWAGELRLRTVGTVLAGTRANADYMCDDNPRFVPAARIVESVLERETEDGLDGAELLMHVGAGPCRSDKLHTRLGGMLDELTRRGYRFLRIDEFGRLGTAPDHETAAKGGRGSR